MTSISTAGLDATATLSGLIAAGYQPCWSHCCSRVCIWKCCRSPPPERSLCYRTALLMHHWGAENSVDTRHPESTRGVQQHFHIEMPWGMFFVSVFH